MRILFIHNRYQLEGGEDVALALQMQLLKDHGHDIEVITFDNNQINGFSKITAGLKAFYNLSSAKRTSQVITQFKPAIIHIHNLFFTASPSVLFVAKKHNIPVIFTLHNYRLICANALLLRNNKICELCVNKKFPWTGIKYRCYRKSFIESALVTGITSFHKIIKTWNHYISQYILLTEFAKNKMLHSSLDLNEEKISVIPNFIPDSKAVLEKKEFFLYVGRISKEKGVNILVDAFANLKSEKILIVGEGPEKANLELLSLHNSNINFMGKKSKSEVLDLMQQCKALIFPSICYEGLPFTILEAFASGTPVIASDIGAMTHLITNDYNGLHFTVNNPEDLQHCITRFNNLSVEEKLKLAARSRNSYETRYHPKIYYNAIIKVYTKALEENK